MSLTSDDELLDLFFESRPFVRLEELIGQAERRKFADDGIEFALQGFGMKRGEAIVLKQGNGHAPDEALFELGLRLEMAHLGLERAQIGRPVIRGKQEIEGRQIFFVEFDVFAGGDGVHGAAVFAFGGDGAFGFGSVLAGDCGAVLALFAGQFFA
jgi:hypothetical protein